MANQVRVKVTLSPYHRELLEWGAALLGEAPATYAAQLLTECLSRTLDDPDVRRHWISRPRRTLEELSAPLEGDGEGRTIEEIRHALLPRAVSR
jgi:hypothetical protein